jgi:hypothetical protein
MRTIGHENYTRCLQIDLVCTCCLMIPCTIALHKHSMQLQASGLCGGLEQCAECLLDYRTRSMAIGIVSRPGMDRAAASTA